MRALGRREPTHKAFNGHMLCGDSGCRQGCAHPPHYLSGSLRSPHGLATLAPCLRAPRSPCRPSRVRFQRGTPTHPPPTGLPPSPPVGGSRPSSWGLRAFAPTSSARATALPLSPALYGSSGSLYLFFPLSGRLQNLSVGSIAVRRVANPFRRVAPLPLSGSCTGSDRCATSPLRGTAVVATLRFFSATALSCAHPRRGFPIGGVALSLPPSEGVRLPAT